jgi:hypothetical protein
MKRHEENVKVYYQVKEANLRRLNTAWFQLYDVLARQKSKKASGCQGLGGRNNESMEFLEQWEYSIVYYKGGYLWQFWPVK